jgi:hypothetical protein
MTVPAGLRENPGLGPRYRGHGDQADHQQTAPQASLRESHLSPVTIENTRRTGGLWCTFGMTVKVRTRQLRLRRWEVHNTARSCKRPSVQKTACFDVRMDIARSSFSSVSLTTLRTIAGDNQGDAADQRGTGN